MKKKDLKHCAIFCKTKEDALQCCMLANSLGYRWFTNDRYCDYFCWSSEFCCYDFFKGKQISIEYANKHAYSIQSSEWFLDNFKIKDMETNKEKGTLAELYNCANDNIKKKLEAKFSKKDLGIENDLPTSWEEFCSTVNVKDDEVYISSISNIRSIGMKSSRNKLMDKMIIPNKEYTEGILALMQLLQLRDYYRKGWKPDYTNETHKYCIYYYNNNISKVEFRHTKVFLSFQSNEVRDKFFNNFKDLIEKAKEFI